MIKSKKFKALVFLIVVVFTFVLRAHNYEKTPSSNHLDEMLYAWSGLYLIETGVPVSWSTLDYPKRAEVFKGVRDYKGGRPQSSVTLYKPWLDEPPLFALLVGYFAHQFGANREEFIPSTYIRIPMIFLGLFTSILVFLITRKLSGFWMGVLSMLVFGTVPIFVFASRTALPENLIGFLFVGIIYLLLRFKEQLKLRYILFIPLLIGIAGLSKPTGFLLAPFAMYFIFLIFKDKNKVKEGVNFAFYILLTTLFFVGLFISYGLYYDPEIFRIITSIQSFRPVGFGGLAWFLTSPSYGTEYLKDSWYVFCLIASFFFLLKPLDNDKRIISLGFVYWLAVLLFTGGENDLLAWYRFPAFPLMAIMGAWGLQYMVKNANIFTSFLAVGLLLGNRYLLVNPFRPNVTPGQFRAVFTTLMLPSILFSIFNMALIERLSRVVIIFTIAVGIYINSIYIYNAYEIKCENVDCPIVPTTSLSTIHFPLLWRLFVLK